MDIVSHALWGYAVLRKQGRRKAAKGLFAGAAPDLFYFVPWKIFQIAEHGLGPALVAQRQLDPDVWKAGGPPLPVEVAEAYDRFYVWTHSFVLLALAVGICFLLRRRSLAWLALPYGLHIAMDIPTHERYQTQFLYPLSAFAVEGVSWGHPLIFWPNWIALLLTLFFVERRARSDLSMRRATS